jgi:hypothetical protein
LLSGYYTINPATAQPISITSITPNKVSPQPAGTTIRWTSNTTGGQNPLYYFRVYKGSVEVANSGTYTSNNYFDWTPAEAGSDYRVRVNVKDNTTTVTLLSGYYTIN